MRMKNTCLSISVLWIAFGSTVAVGGPASVLNASFEVGEISSWTVVRQYADLVASNTSFFEGSNLDGVAGSRFLLFGMGSDRGKIRFAISSIPGKTYTLSYWCGATDTQRLPIGSGSGFQVTFGSSVQAYHGKKTVIDHTGLPVEIDDLENLDFRTHTFSTPGTWNWRIYNWLPVSYSFVAKSRTTWIEFDTQFTTGMASVGVLDQVLVTTDPFTEISVSNEGARIDFAGKLQQTEDLLTWTDVSPQPASPWTITSAPGKRFFRVAK